VSGEDQKAANGNNGLTEKQLAQKLKREAAKKKKEEEQKAKKAEQDAKKEAKKQSQKRFSLCTKVGQPMAVAYKQAMEQLEKAKKKGLQDEDAFKLVTEVAKVVGTWKDQAAKALASYACNPFETSKETSEKVKDLQQSVKKLKELMAPKPKKSSPEK